MSVEKAQNVSMTIVNPVAKVESKTITPAASLTSLEGKKIALWWNGKAKGDIALKTIAARLKKSITLRPNYLLRAGLMVMKYTIE